MAKRLQVILHDTEYREIQRVAKARRMTVAAWVRQALATARRYEPIGDAGKKLDIVRDAARQEFPTADIEEMLAEIERGYGAGDRR